MKRQRTVTRATTPQRRTADRTYKYTPARGDGREIKIRRIPVWLFDRVSARAKREDVSLRKLLLTYLEAWAASKTA